MNTNDEAGHVYELSLVRFAGPLTEVSNKKPLQRCAFLTRGYDKPEIRL